MADEITTTVGTRINLDLLGDINLELKKTGKKMAQWIKEAIEEKLQNDNAEILDAEIEFLQKKLELLLKRKLLIKDKVKNIKNVPENEIKFLIETKKIIDKDYSYLPGRIRLYKNQFRKNYKISEQEFLEMLDNAHAQSILVNTNIKK